MISMIVQISILMLVISKSITLFTRGDNKISSYAINVDLSTEPGVNYNSTKMTTYHVLRKQLDDDGPVFLDDATSQYIDIFFAQETVNWHLSYKDRVKQNRYPAKYCTRDEFSPGIENDKIYAEWNGFTLICPDLKEGQGFRILGNSDSMVTNSYKFQINRCNQTL
jgi:hypothetical protein